MNVNIYIVTTAKGARNATAGFCYILEAVIEGKEPATVTASGKYENVTKNQAEARTLAKAMQRVKLGNEVTLWIDSQYIKSVLNTWLDGWKKNGWKNAKGEDISPEWKEVAYLLVGREIKEIKNEPHTYKTWMLEEAEREKRNETV